MSWTWHGFELGRLVDDAEAVSKVVVRVRESVVLVVSDVVVSRVVVVIVSSPGVSTKEVVVVL